MTEREAPTLAVCFVCLGNICRSPTAEGVLRSVLRSAGLEARVVVESAGTLGYHQGELPDRRSRAAARERGIELSSRARQFSPADWQRFDYVLAMDRQNLEHLAASAPNAAARAKLRLFRDFDPSAPAGAEVPDPYYGGPEGFEHVLDLCQAAAQGLLQHLQREHGV
ncbi:MAG TPA: low molecular weight protein-tyrosine-phosphatase [Polyangiaceae bacterium]|nr:low molecular weight protein-tyrosine-phosphatase [Polyangiaceae bacterium]